MSRETEILKNEPEPAAKEYGPDADIQESISAGGAPENAAQGRSVPENEVTDGSMQAETVQDSDTQNNAAGDPEAQEKAVKDGNAPENNRPENENGKTVPETVPVGKAPVKTSNSPDIPVKTAEGTEIPAARAADQPLSETAKNAIYSKARGKMKEGRLESYREAVSLFSNIPGWKDSDLQATRCFHRISKIKSDRKEKVKEIIKDSIIIAITSIIVGLVFRSIIPGIQYNSAGIMMEEGNYEGAEGVYRTLGDYSDSAEKLEICEAVIREENYQKACECMEAGDFSKARKIFEELGSYKDSAVQSAEIMDYLYSRASALRSSGDLQEALETFAELDGYQDSEIQADEISAEILEKTGTEAVISAEENETEQETVPAEEETEEEKQQKKLQLILIILAASVLLFCLAGIPVYFRLVKPYLAYKKACGRMDAGLFEEAITIFRDLEDYRDSRKKVKECEAAILNRRYEAACQRMNAGEYEGAILSFTSLNGYRDSLEMIQKCKTAILDLAYQEALRMKEEKRFPEAVEAFRELKGYRDANFQATLCSIAIEKEPVYQEACGLLEKDLRKEALALFNELKGYRDTSEKIKKIKTLYYKEALGLMKEKHYPEAISAFSALEGFKDSSGKIMECRQLILEGKYREAKFLMEQEEYESAIDIFRVLRTYGDSPLLLVKCRKAIRAPRPFSRLMVGMTVEEALGVFGEALRDQKNRKTGFRELVFSGSRLMDAVGYLTLEFEKDRLVRSTWSADFCWEPYERENEGLFPGIEYAKYRDYYTFLFGECTSEYLKDNHKGSWWRNPELTVDVSGYDYVTIHFSFRETEEGQ